MNSQEFKGWLEKGLGRAVLFVQQNDDRPYREVLLHACTHNLTYDRQCEEGRGRYLFDLIQATRDPAFYRDRVIASLLAPLEEEDREQLFDIALELALRGDDGARQAMYTAFTKGADEENLLGGSELIALDGVPGFLFAAARCPWRECDCELAQIRWWLSRLEERDGKEAAWKALDNIGGEQPEIAQMVAAVRQYLEEERKKREQRTARTDPDYEAVKASIMEPGRKARSRFWGWGRRASEEAIEQAAKDLLAEDEPDRLFSYLSIFCWRRFPGDPAHLIALTRSSDERGAWEAMNALEQVDHPSVRVFALELASEAKWGWRAVGLLTRNFEDGDHRIVESLLEKPWNIHDFHHLSIDARGFYENHPSIENIRGLLLLYEKGPCSLCRRGVVNCLIKLAALPDWMWEECRYDSYLETRKSVESSGG